MRGYYGTALIQDDTRGECLWILFKYEQCPPSGVTRILVYCRCIQLYLQPLALLHIRILLYFSYWLLVIGFESPLQIQFISRRNSFCCNCLTYLFAEQTQLSAQRKCEPLWGYADCAVLLTPPVALRGNRAVVLQLHSYSGEGHLLCTKSLKATVHH